MLFQLKNFKCGQCGYRSYLRTDLEKHLSAVHQKQRTICPVCGKQYSDLRQHIRLVHEGRKVQKLYETRPTVFNVEVLSLSPHTTNFSSLFLSFL